MDVKKAISYLKKAIECLEENEVVEDNNTCGGLPQITLELDGKKIAKAVIPKQPKRFVVPTVEEVKEYCLSRNNNIDAEYFVNYYDVRDWTIGKNKIKDWKACVRTWELNAKKRNATITMQVDGTDIGEYVVKNDNKWESY